MQPDTIRRINPADAHQALAAVLEASPPSGRDDTSYLIYDLDLLRSRVEEAVLSFPDTTLHALAVKANPLPGALNFIMRETGPGRRGRLGLEAASLPELVLALEQVPPERVVFDSPAKTVEELRLAMARGVGINLDNFQELDRAAALARELWPNQDQDLDQGDGAKPRPYPWMIGLRVNPQVGGGSIEATGTAAVRSKFGVPLSESRDAVIDAFAAHPWLTGLHCHVGSQGCSLDLLAEGAARLTALARDIGDRLGRNRVKVLDIGGGLPVTYGPDDSAPDFPTYAQALEDRCPDLFAGPWRVVTEFGRSIHANAAFAATRVEYVKVQQGRTIAVVHMGADMFVRPCYAPGDWRHEVILADGKGNPRTGPLAPVDIAGPLCFSGDFPARDAMLPPVSQGDWMIFRDAGAYTLGMWSRYNSRPSPAVLGFKRGPSGLSLKTIKPRESVQDVLRFWGRPSCQQL